MTDLTGRIAAVDTLPLGGTLAIEALAGSTLLHLEDTADFDEDGGMVLVGDTELLAYSSCDDDAGTIVLAEPTAALWEVDTRVELWDATANGLVVETIAQVLVEGMEQSGDSLVATVDHALIALLPTGMRDPDPETGLIGEAVSLTWRGDELFVTDILGQRPMFDGTVIDPDTLPPGGGPLPVEPVTPGAPTVFGGIGTLMIRWAGIIHPNPVVFEVHVSDVSGFVASESTHVGDISGTALTVRRLPIPDVEAETPDSALRYDTTYYVALIAKDSVDESYASGKSPEGSGSPVQATDGDLAPDSVTTNQLTAGAVQAENLAAEIGLLGRITVGGEVGQRLELDPDGQRFVRSDGSIGINLPTAEGEDPSFRGRIQADGLTVREGATFYSPLNEFARGSVISLAEQVAGPVAGPIPQISWDYTELVLSERTAGLGTFALDPSQVKSVSFSPSNDTVYIVQHRNGGTRIWYYNMNGTHYACWDSVDGQRKSSIAVGPDGEFRFLYKYDGNWWYRWYTGNNNYVTNRYIPQNPNRNPYMFMDGTDIYVAETSTSGPLIIRRITTNADGQNVTIANTTTTSGVGNANYDPCMAYRGSADFGGTAPRWVVSYQNQFVYRVFSGGGSYDDTLIFSPPVSKVGGFWNPNDSRFYTLGSNGRLYQHSFLTWTDPVLDTWHVGQSFFKDGSGMETAIGTVTSFEMKKRARVIFTVAEVPYSGESGDPDSWQMFGKRGAAPLPDRSDMHSMAVGRYYHTFYNTANAPPLTGPTPLMFGTFPGGTPARLRSGRTMPADPSKNIFEVRGDGSGRWGPIEIDATGEFSAAYDTGWVPLTYSTGWSGDGMVRRIGDMVGFKGSSTGTPTSGTVVVGWIPASVGAWPPASETRDGLWYYGTGVASRLRVRGSDGGIQMNGHSTNVSANPQFSVINYML